MLDVEQTSCVHTQMSQTPQHSTGKWIQVSYDQFEFCKQIKSLFRTAIQFIE